MTTDPNELFDDPRMATARAALAKRWRESGLHDDETLPEALARAARDTPDVYMLFPSEARPGRLNMRDLDERARRMASALAERGLASGDVVAVQLPNWEEVAIAYLAVAMLGGVIVPIVHIYGPHETDWIIRASGARLFISPDRWGNIDFLARAEQMPALASIDRIVVGDEIPPGASSWRDVEDAGDPHFEPAARRAEDPLMVVYTSGTTSDPKGVLHTHQTLLADMRNLPWDRSEYSHRLCLHLFPAGHIGGACALLGTIITGKPVVLIDRWDPRQAAVLIEEHEIDRFTGAPFHVAGLLDLVESGEFSCTSLRTVMTGAAGVPPTLVERADRAGWRVVRAYGSSEHPTATASPFSSELAKRARTDGPALDHTELRITLENGEEAPRGEPGEVWLRGPEQFLGYTDPALNREAFGPDGWFRSGDVGVVDAEGCLTITDRIKDIIIRGGENLSSLEIEGLLARHPAIAEAAVVAMPDPRYGERVCAFLLLAPGAEPPDLPDLLRHFDAQGAARQKTPERIVVLDELPRTPTGKVKKHELRAQL
ncbi:MAG: AMP-binding protein [Phycisphaerales bacterium JB058]